MIFRLDTVSGAELDASVYEGRIIRTGLITGITVPFSGSDPTILIQALAVQGMPQRGDPFPHPNYKQYFCKRHIVRSIQTSQATVAIIYEFNGATIVGDSSTLAVIPSQIHPTGDPFYVDYTVGKNKITKSLTMNVPMPLRHFSVQKTVPFQASDAVLNSFRCVNGRYWHGLPRGFWLLSSLDAETNDNGVTYTYKASWSTKFIESWLQFGFIEDDRGNAVAVDPLIVRQAKLMTYFYGVKKLNGITVAGNFYIIDFERFFGIR